MATQKDIARILNISQQAVSACFGPGNTTVKPSLKTRERVLEVAREIGYVPNRMARSLKSGKSRSIGVILPYCQDPYYACLIDALTFEAARRDYSLDLQFHFWSRTQEQNAFRKLLGAKVEGILACNIALPKTGATPHHLLETCPVPVVALTAKETGRHYTAVIEKDYFVEGRLLGEHLLRLGHTDIDFLHPGSPEFFLQQEKLNGLLEAIEASGVRAAARFVEFPSTVMDAFRPKAPASPVERDAVIELMAKYYIAGGRRGTAVVVGNEMVAWKVMREAARQQLRIPEDLSVVCSGLLGQGDTGPVPLTSAEYDPAEIASRALGALIDGAGSHCVRPTLMVRHSSRAPSGGLAFAAHSPAQEKPRPSSSTSVA